jgi:hypothetical protein
LKLTCGIYGIGESFNVVRRPGWKNDWMQAWGLRHNDVMVFERHNPKIHVWGCRVAELAQIVEKTV